jgi:glycosyltransferase involved in cell wall biosynthesis
MNILICTAIPLNRTSASLNRLNLLSNSLEGLDNNVYFSGYLEPDHKSILSKKSSRNKEKNDFFLSDKKIICNFPKKNVYLPLAFRINLNASFFYKKNLNQILNKFKIEVVIIYSTFSTFIEPVVSLCKKNKIKCIADVGERRSISLKSLLNGVLYMQTRALLYSFHKLDGFIVLTPKWKKFTDSIKKSSVLFPAIIPKSKDSLNVSKLEQNSKFRVVFMGILFAREKPKVLLKAIEIALLKGLSIELVVIGKQGPTIMMSLLQGKILRKMKNNKNIILTGFLNKSEKDTLLKSANCFVHLRKESDETAYVFPTRLAEYFNASKPLVISKVEPFSLFYEHKKEVYFVDNALDPNQLANAFIELSENPKLAKEIGLKGKDYALKNYSSDYIGREINNFLVNLISNN